MIDQVRGEKIGLWVLTVGFAIITNNLLGWGLGALNILGVAIVATLATAFLARVVGAASQRGALAEAERYGGELADIGIEDIAINNATVINE